MQRSLNYNAQIRIKLEPQVIRILEKECGRLYIEKFISPNVKDGYFKMPLWKIMQIFGKYTRDDYFPFEADFLIDDSELK